MGSAEVDISKLITADADSLAVKLSTKGEVRLKLSWVPREMGKVVLHIQRAAGLEKVGSSSGMPSAYGVIVLHGKDHRTSTLKDTTTPEWKQKFEWTGIKSELTRTAMKIEIRDHDHAYLREHGQAPVLGRAEVLQAFRAQVGRRRGRDLRRQVRHTVGEPHRRVDRRLGR